MPKEQRSLAGRVVAITGGARGIGRSTAEALIAGGARVALGDVDVEAVEQTAAELGSGTTGHRLDVTDRGAFEIFVDEVEAAHGPLDVLVNNAGIMQLGPFTEERDATAIRMVDINVHGVIFGMKVVLPRMQARGAGHIVNLASVAGKGGFPHAATYCASKHAVVGVSEAVRAELRETPIEVSCVMPALVNTELGAGVEAGRAVDKIEPKDVAAEIVDALRSPRFDVYVPRKAGRISKVMQLVPRSGREAIARWLKADRILADVDTARRAAYSERVQSLETHAAEAPLEGEREPVR